MLMAPVSAMAVSEEGIGDGGCLGAGDGFWVVGLQEDSKDKGQELCKQCSIISLTTTSRPIPYLSSEPLLAVEPLIVFLRVAFSL